MKEYRVSFYGIAGFNTKDFDTKEEAFCWVGNQTKYNLIRPVKCMRYNAESDTYKVIGEFTAVVK